MTESSPQENAKQPIPTGLLLAAILCALWALVTTALGLRALLAGAGGTYLGFSESGAMLAAVWKTMIAAVYVLFCIRILELDWKWGWVWPFAVNSINAIISLIFIISSFNSGLDFESKGVSGFTLLIELAIIALLHFNKKHFGEKAKKPLINLKSVFADNQPSD